MSSVKIKLNSSEIRAFLKSGQMADMTSAYAKQIAGKKGSEYNTDLYRGKNRVNSGVYRRKR